MKVAITGKGGVGKTTLASTLARLYADEGRTVLAADVDPDDNQLGLTGSPTKVKKIENVVFQAKEAKKLTADDKQIEELMVELIASHTLG